jgi:hypothetical protein
LPSLVVLLACCYRRRYGSHHGWSTIQVVRSHRGWSAACCAREGGGLHHQLVTRAAPTVEDTHAPAGTSPPGGGKGRRRRCLGWRGLDTAATRRSRRAVHFLWEDPWEELPCVHFCEIQTPGERGKRETESEGRDERVVGAAIRMIRKPRD